MHLLLCGPRERLHRLTHDFHFAEQSDVAKRRADVRVEALDFVPERNHDQCLDALLPIADVVLGGAREHRFVISCFANEPAPVGKRERFGNIARREQSTEPPVGFVALAQHLRETHDRRPRMFDDIPQRIAAFDAVMLFRVAHQQHAGANVVGNFSELVELLRGQ